VYLPGGGVALTSWTEPLSADAAAIGSGPLTLTCVEPLRTWRIDYDGELRRFDDPAAIPAAVAAGEYPAPIAVRLSLEATGLHPPVFYPGYARTSSPPPHTRRAGGWRQRIRRALRLPRDISAALRMRSAEHYEQSMQVRGEIVVAGERHRFDGSGHRDHSWGLRDWGALQHMRWLTGQLDGLAFNAVYITLAGSSVTNGYLWVDGGTEHVSEVRLENSFDASGLAARDVALTLRAGEREVVVEGSVLRNVPLPLGGDGTSTIYTVGWTRYRCGGRTGYGVAEFLERVDP
jgi:hypothetical protein